MTCSTWLYNKFPQRFALMWCHKGGSLLSRPPLPCSISIQSSTKQWQFRGLGGGSNVTRGGGPSGPPPSTVPWPSTSPLKGLFVRAVESRDHQSSASTMFRKSIVVRRMWDVRVKYAWHSSCTHRCTRNASRCMLVQAHTHTYLRLHAYGVSSTALVCARWENLWNKVCICISIL